VPKDMEMSAFTKTMARTLSALHANLYRLFGGATRVIPVVELTPIED